MSTSSKTQSGSGPAVRDFNPSSPLYPVWTRCPADSKSSVVTTTASGLSSTMRTFDIFEAPTLDAAQPRSTFRTAARYSPVDRPSPFDHRLFCQNCRRLGGASVRGMADGRARGALFAIPAGTSVPITLVRRTMSEIDSGEWAHPVFITTTSPGFGPTADGPRRARSFSASAATAAGRTT
jgi:hypothetical protein